MEIVTVRNPSLASEVKRVQSLPSFRKFTILRIVTVLLSEWSADTVFREFFRCLSLLPNLDTVQLVRAPYSFSDLDLSRTERPIWSRAGWVQVS
ncbi:hypothetical protein B0H19DRAFT_1143996 [Mycena capillaripes]|nr:hypothetical protein B0H19DRAFT_1143996 [Mycena capillaripes]